jgi:hypothetical protein
MQPYFLLSFLRFHLAHTILKHLVQHQDHTLTHSPSFPFLTPTSNQPPHPFDRLSHHLVRQGQRGENMKMMRQAGIVLQPCADAEIGEAFLQDDAVVAHRVFLRGDDIGGREVGENVVWGEEGEVRGGGAGCVDVS